MIKSFRHQGLEAFFRTGTKKDIQPQHATELQILLAALDNSTGPDDMNAPNWRLTFRFAGKNAEPVDYQDCH